MSDFEIDGLPGAGLAAAEKSGTQLDEISLFNNAQAIPMNHYILYTCRTA